MYARSVRRLAENGGSEENLKAVIEKPQKPRLMTTDDAGDPRAVPEVHEHENQNEEANENGDEDGETPDKQTTRIMTWRGRRFQSQTQQRRRAQAEERSAQKHKKTCS